MNWIFVWALFSVAVTTVLGKGSCKVNYGGCDKKHGKCWESTDSVPYAITSYCTCKAGYKPFKGRPGKCVDLNECTTGMHDCDTTHGRCINTIGGYKCKCNCDFMLDYSGTKCLRACHVNGVCYKKYAKCRGKRSTDEIDNENEDRMPDMFMPRFFLDRSEKMKASEDEESRRSALLDMLMEMKNGENEYEEDESDSLNLDEMSPAMSYKGIMTNKDIVDKAATCKCETGYKKNKCGRCQDINECRSKGTNKCSHKCHNSDGGYYCTCPKGKVLGPCAFKCYTIAKRPKVCNNQKKLTAAHLSNKALAEKDGFTEADLLTYVSEKSAALGYKHAPLLLKHYGACTKIGTYATESFDLNYDGKTDMTVQLICRKGRSDHWQIYSARDKEAYWKPWSCWTECKGSCTGGIMTRQRECKNGLGDYGKCTGPATQTKGCYVGKKCPLRVRKSATTLTVAEKKDLIQAMNKFKKDLYSTYGYHSAASTHQWPNQCTSQETGKSLPCCHHGARLNFVMWHRAELKNYEMGLTRFLKDKTLGAPYWDWIKSLTPPSLIWSKKLYGKTNPFSGMDVRLDWNVVGKIYRVKNFNTGTGGGGDAVSYFTNEVTKLMKSNMLHILSESIENAHNFIHAGVCGVVGGICDISMGELKYAAFDPLFFFHHSNVDRIFAMYQNQALKNKEMKWNRQAALEPQQMIYEFNNPYHPFHDKNLTPWKSIRAVSALQDLYHYQELLGYKYDTLAAHGHKVLTGTIYKQDQDDDVIEDGDEIEAKAHLANGADKLNIIHFQRSLGKNVAIRYFFAGSDAATPVIDCATIADSSPYYLGRLLILGSKGEREWKNPQPTVFDISSFVSKNGQAYRLSMTGNFAIKPCYTEQTKCKSKCTVTSLPATKKLPTPQLAYYPSNTVVDIYRFKWDVNEVFPSWAINLRSGKEWMQFEGTDKNNVVQVKTLTDFKACNTNGATAVTCSTGPCLLPRGAHYFIHKNKSNCIKGMKLHVLARF